MSGVVCATSTSMGPQANPMVASVWQPGSVDMARVARALAIPLILRKMNSKNSLGPNGCPEDDDRPHLYIPVLLIPAHAQADVRACTDVALTYAMEGRLNAIALVGSWHPHATPLSMGAGPLNVGKGAAHTPPRSLVAAGGTPPMSSSGPLGKGNPLRKGFVEAGAQGEGRNPLPAPL